MRGSVGTPVRGPAGRGGGPIDRGAWSGSGPLRKQFSASVKQAGDPADRVLVFTISTAGVDRDRDTIAVDGWDLANYRNNPVVLWGHDYSGLVVARSLRVWVEDGKLKSRTQFVDEGVYSFADTVYELYRRGFMRAVSVGFLPLEWSEAEDDGRPYGVDFKRQELLEFSCVTVPSNPDAVIAASAAHARRIARGARAGSGSQEVALERSDVEQLARDMGDYIGRTAVRELDRARGRLVD